MSRPIIWNSVLISWYQNVVVLRKGFKCCTKTTASRAVRAVISAHDTIAPQRLCTCLRMLSIISIALALRLRFGGASCSLGPLAEPSSNTDASHPCRFTCVRNYHLSSTFTVYQFIASEIGTFSTR